jgi:mannose-6-phosphate isomerase-like protein (cupin superfamily)
MSDPQVQRGVHLGNGEGKSFWLLTDLHTFKATARDTNGAMTVAELKAGHEISPPPHIHRNNDECFYVLEGTFDFSLAGRAFSAGVGSFVLLPKGVAHTHRAGGGKPARALVIQTPAGVEGFIEEAGRPAPDRSAMPAAPELPELQNIIGIAGKHGIEVP